MAELQTFRSAFNGFNREDVVRYIEYLNTRHNDQIAQLNNELAQVREQLAAAQAEPDRQADLELRLEEAQDRCAALEAELADTAAKLEQALNANRTAQVRTESELEAYRRAERTERLARERAEQLYAQANGALAEATTMVDEAAGQIGSMANNLAAQMTAFRDTVIGTKSVLADAAAAMYAIRPCADDQN
jgi:chromosome segregation ATPase